ncbi:MAG: pilus assembly protein PilM [Bacilli bacterium]|nr:pilus assembly protein PilM [Bacilli bacterium]
MKKDNIVYLSNENVELIVGCDDHRDMVKIYNYKSYPFAEGSILNGVITDEYEIKNTLKQVAADGYHDVNLVIDSSQILSRNMVVPKLNKDEIYKVVADELASVAENSEDLVYDYAYLGPSSQGKGSIQILGCAVERKLISNYLEIFSECGIKINAIDFSINIIGKMCKELIQSNYKNYLFSVLDGNNLTSVLFENDSYKLSYRSRVISQRDTIMFEQEVTNNIANIYQFSKSGENSSPIEGILFCGLHEQEMGILNRLQSNLNISANVIEMPSSIYVVNNRENFQLDKYLLPVGYLLKK